MKATSQIHFHELSQKLEQIKAEKAEQIRLRPPLMADSKKSVPVKAKKGLFSDRIERLVAEKLTELTKDDKQELRKVNVLAAITMGDMRGGEKVVAIASGSHCAEMEDGKSGLAAHESHAESLVRRAFMFYLVCQLKRAANGQPSIFIQSKEKGFFHLAGKLQPQFRLYVSDVACGACPEPEKSFGRLLGLTHTNALLKWGVLGVQGAVLLNCMPEIHLSTLLVGGHFPGWPQDLSKTLSERVAKLLPTVQPPNVVSMPFMVVVQNSLLETSGEPVPHRVVWFEGAEELRVLRVDEPALDKKELFAQLLEVAQEYGWRFPSSYIKAKSSRPVYQAMKAELRFKFGDDGLLDWIKENQRSRLFHDLQPLLKLAEKPLTPAEILTKFFPKASKFDCRLARDADGHTTHEVLAFLNNKSHYGVGETRATAMDRAALKALNDFLGANTSCEDFLQSLKRDLRRFEEATKEEESNPALESIIETLNTRFGKSVRLDTVVEHCTEGLPWFSCIAKVETKVFAGQGLSKAVARMNAANQALFSLILQKAEDGAAKNGHQNEAINGFEK